MLAFGLFNYLIYITMFGKYNLKGRIETGFDNYGDHMNYGHPSNPEYQQECQDAEMTDRINQEIAIECRNDDLDNPKEPHWIEELIEESRIEREATDLLDIVKKEVHIGFINVEFLQMKYNIDIKVAELIINKIRICCC